MCDVLSYRSDHLVRPFLGKKWEIMLEQHEQIRIRIHSKSLAYRRDSCSNGFDLIPKQKKNPRGISIWILLVKVAQ